jgi:histidinol-phosphate aminotransferase
MNNIQKLITHLLRPGIAALKPYSSARDEFTGDASVFLDANENSLGGPLKEDFSRYPDPLQMPLRQALAALKSVQPDQIFIGNGSDEAIDMLMRAFVEPGRDNVVLLPPTYGMYAVQANIHGAEIRRAPLRSDFSPHAEAVLSVSDAHSKLLFLCSPNNPTGQCLPDDFVLEMLEKFPGIVVVDEAYGDFTNRPSWTQRLAEFPNLVVLQTLSKAWGLAGLRVGMAFSNTFIINALNKIKYPYNLNQMTIRLALQALQQPETVYEKVHILLAERRRLERELPLLPCVENVFPSDANFLLVRVTNADEIYRYLCEQGIIVRNRNKELHCSNCLRITVGTPSENDLLLTKLGEVGRHHA